MKRARQKEEETEQQRQKESEYSLTETDRDRYRQKESGYSLTETDRERHRQTESVYSLTETDIDSETTAKTGRNAHKYRQMHIESEADRITAVSETCLLTDSNILHIFSTVQHVIARPKLKTLY